MRGHPRVVDEHDPHDEPDHFCQVCEVWVRLWLVPDHIRGNMHRNRLRAMRRRDRDPEAVAREGVMQDISNRRQRVADYELRNCPPLVREGMGEEPSATSCAEASSAGADRESKG